MKKLTNKLLDWLNAEDASVFDNAMELKMQEPKEEKEETVEASWDVQDPNMPEWLKQYI